MVIVAILVYVFPYQVCRIFLKNETIINSAIRFLRIMGIPFIVVPLRSMARGFIGGTGHTKILLFSSISAGIVELSLMFILKRFGMDNLIMLGCAIIGYMLFETSINVAYYFSNKWKKSII
jgi:Na+-driven multidrug efflux pump